MDRETVCGDLEGRREGGMDGGRKGRKEGGRQGEGEGRIGRMEKAITWDE